MSQPWDPAYGEESKQSVGDNVVLINTLTEYTTAILKAVDLSEKFWSLLFQRGVVDEDAKTRIQAYKQRQAQAAALVLHMMTVEVYKFQGFIWALVNSNQCHLAEQLGFAVRDYLDVKVYLTSSSFQCPACHEFFTKVYILSGCGHYVCAPCVKGAQFICKDDKKEDITCPIPECHKTTESSPSTKTIGLEEDEDFSQLSQAILKETTTGPAGTTEGKSTAGSKEEEGMSNSGRKEEDEKSTTGSEEHEGTSERMEDVKLSQHLQAMTAERDLEKRISCLQKYEVILGKYEAGVKEYITEIVERVKKNVDEWAKQTLGWYSSVSKQVEKNLQKSIKWQKAASELSVLVKAKPGFLEGCLKAKVNLPKETVTGPAAKLISKLDAGCPIPSLFPYKPCISIPPAKAKFLMNCDVGGELSHRKLAWTPDGSLMVITKTGVCRLDLNTDTGKSRSTLIQETNKAVDMSVAADGTWILSQTNGIIEINYPGLEESKNWRPEGVEKPRCVFINNKNIFVREYYSQIIRSYSRELVYKEQFDIGTNADYGYIHVTERGRLVMRSETESRIYIMDLETKKASSFGRKGKGDGELSYPNGVCTVNDDDYILVCDCGNKRVSVFTHDGQFIHHLDVEGGVQRPYNIAVLARRGKPTLMAVYGSMNCLITLSVYSLE